MEGADSTTRPSWREPYCRNSYWAWLTGDGMTALIFGISFFRRPLTDSFTFTTHRFIHNTHQHTDSHSESKSLPPQGYR